MCKKMLQGLFGGGAQEPAAIIQPALAARPVGSVVKGSNTPLDAGAVISTTTPRKKKPGQNDVPGLGL